MNGNLSLLPDPKIKECVKNPVEGEGTVYPAYTLEKHPSHQPPGDRCLEQNSSSRASAGVWRILAVTEQHGITGVLLTLSSVPFLGQLPKAVL